MRFTLTFVPVLGLLMALFGLSVWIGARGSELREEPWFGIGGAIVSTSLLCIVLLLIARAIPITDVRRGIFSYSISILVLAALAIWPSTRSKGGWISLDIRPIDLYSYAGFLVILQPGERLGAMFAAQSDRMATTEAIRSGFEAKPDSIIAFDNSLVVGMDVRRFKKRDLRSLRLAALDLKGTPMRSSLDRAVLEMGGEQTGALIVPDRAGRVLTIGRDPIYPYEFNAQVITEHGDVLTGAAIARAACGLADGEGHFLIISYEWALVRLDRQGAVESTLTLEPPAGMPIHTRPLALRAVNQEIHVLATTVRENESLILFGRLLSNGKISWLLQTSVGDNANHGYVGDFAPDASAVVALGAGWQKLFWIRKDGSSDSGFTVHAEQATNCTSIRSLAVTDSNVFVVCEGNRETRSNTGNRRLVALRRDGFLDPRFKSSF
ncbi:MAG TPA: hypothetical protein VKB87_21860 [Myxococcaceae bacterium]|nr:hypothetical protein [Myxococcaceae bacterium]